MKSLSLITKQTAPIVSRASSLSIETKDDMTASVSLLSQCNKYLDALTADKKSLTDPIMASLKAIRAKYAPTEKPLIEAIAIIRAKQSSYQTALMAKQKLEQNKIADKLAQGKIKIETAVQKISKLDQPDTRLDTDDGSMTFKAVKRLKIIDSTLIPREYLIPDESLILEALKTSQSVPGCTLEEIQVPINRRN